MLDKTDLSLSEGGNGELSKEGLYTFHFIAAGSGATRHDALGDMVEKILNLVVICPIKPKKFIIREEPTLLPYKDDEYKYKVKFSLSEDENYGNDY